MSYDLFEQIMLTEEYRGYKKGTLGLYGGKVFDSGAYYPLFIVLDEDYYSFMKENNFSGIPEYILFRRERYLCDDFKQVLMPFNTIAPYDNNIVSMKKLQESMVYLEEKLNTKKELFQLFMEKLNENR